MVPKSSLYPLSASQVYPPTTVKAHLANFTAEEVKTAGDALWEVLLSSINLQIFTLDENPLPRVIIFTEDFVEINSKNLKELKAVCEKGEESDSWDSSWNSRLPKTFKYLVKFSSFVSRLVFISQRMRYRQTKSRSRK